jgi:hypothetical protein
VLSSYRTERYVMELFYWFLKFSIFFIAILLGNPIYNQTGWWGIAVLILLLLVGLRYFDKKLRGHKQRNMIARFPSLKGLESGNLITVELKNGETYSNFIYMMFNENEMMISRKMELDQVLEGQDDTRWIKLNKIKAIKKADL